MSGVSRFGRFHAKRCGVRKYFSNTKLPSIATTPKSIKSKPFFSNVAKNSCRQPATCAVTLMGHCWAPVMGQSGMMLMPSPCIDR